MTGAFLLRRLLLAVPTLLGVATVVFVLLRVVPGDPIAMMIPPGASDADIDNLRRLYGLDRSIVEQFLIWIGDAVRGDFGISISLRQDVVLLVLGRLPATLELAALAMVMAVSLGMGSAIVAIFWHGGWPELAVDGLIAFTQAVPDFLWGLMFILILGVLVPLLPISGRIDPRLTFEFVSGFYLSESLLRAEFAIFTGLLSHLLLPAAALALPLAAVIARVLKSTLAEVMTQDYIQMARVRGFSRGRIILREALRNALVPTVTLTGVQFTFLLGGTVLIERIFSFPGIGNLAIGAVIDRDLPLIQGLVLTFAVLFIALNLLIDLTYALLNPKVRHG